MNKCLAYLMFTTIIFSAQIEPSQIFVCVCVRVGNSKWLCSVFSDFSMLVDMRSLP